LFCSHPLMQNPRSRVHRQNREAANPCQTRRRTAGELPKRGTFGVRTVSFGRMEPTNGVVGGDVADQQLFTAYGQHDPSPVLTWVPILLGSIASAIVALLFCPVPRSTVVSAAK